MQFKLISHKQLFVYILPALRIKIDTYIRLIVIFKIYILILNMK